MSCRPAQHCFLLPRFRASQSVVEPSPGPHRMPGVGIPCLAGWLTPSDPPEPVPGHRAPTRQRQVGQRRGLQNASPAMARAGFSSNDNNAVPVGPAPEQQLLIRPAFGLLRSRHLSWFMTSAGSPQRCWPDSPQDRGHRADDRHQRAADRGRGESMHPLTRAHP